MSKLRDKFRKKATDLQQTVKDATTIASNFPRYYDKNLMPKDREIWNMKNGEHVFDIIPFFTGKKHPFYKEDTPLPVLFLYVHFNVGPNDEQVVCKAKNKIGDQRCPICEYIKQNNLYTADNELYKRIVAKKRNLYLVWVHDTEKEELKGIQLLDIADFYLNEKLSAIAKVSRGKGLINYTDVDEGKTIVLERSGSGKTTSVKGHHFEDRPEPIPDEILDQIFPIDEIVKWESDYNKVKKLFEVGLGMKTDEDDDGDGDGWESCPAGGEFGVDYDVFEDCDSCKFVDECAQAYVLADTPSEDDDAPFTADSPEDSINEHEDESEEEDELDEEEFDNESDDDDVEPEPEPEQVKKPARRKRTRKPVEDKTEKPATKTRRRVRR